MALGLSRRRMLDDLQAADGPEDATTPTSDIAGDIRQCCDGVFTGLVPNGYCAPQTPHVFATPPPEACSVPWPDNFYDSEVRRQCQTPTSEVHVEAEMPGEGTLTVVCADDLPTDDGDAASLTRLASKDDETEEGNPRAKRLLHRLPDFVTTLIIRNIPYSCSQADLEEEWLMRDFPYDYLHLPLDARNRPLGYAYINFILPIHASAFHSRWHGRFLTKHHFAKSLSVTVAHRQGAHVNLMCVKGNNLKVGVPALFRGGNKLTNEEVLQVIHMVKRSAMQQCCSELRFQ